MERAASRGPNAILKKIKNGNFKVTSRFLGREKKNVPPLRGTTKVRLKRSKFLGHTLDVGYRRIIGTEY